MTLPFPYVTADAAKSIPVFLVSESALPGRMTSFAESEREWMTTHQFTAKPETTIVMPGKDGLPSSVLAGVKDTLNIWSIAHLPAQLPAGTYRVEGDVALDVLEDLALGTALAQYLFTRYRKVERKRFTFVLPDEASVLRVTQRYEAIALARDLINTPTNDMGPTELAASAETVAKRMGAEIRIVKGDDLLKQNYPAVHAVGRAADNPPHYIDIRWGNPTHPKVTLVGKGVCFDTGGLDIKPYSSMKLMKKDMGGAALMLGLAQLIADAALPVRLRVLIPAVENSISGNAFRPQDVVPTRKGLTIEIGSTDAEGRVILSDALAEADDESPDLIIDAATLTGAARTALGTELPALFSSDATLSADLMRTSMEVADPLWPLPLWESYDRYIKSPIADIANSPNYAYGGAITAALFLKRFVTNTKHWVHIDTMAWNIDALPGRPVGGEALGLRALFTYIKERYSK